MGTRVEQPGELVPCAGRAGCRDLEDLADPLHRLPPAAKDLQVIVQSRNRTLLLQGTFCITLLALVGMPIALTIFNFEGYRRGVRSRPGLARKPSSRPGRYCIRRSRVLTSAVS